jgi:hypothetical protein
VRYLEIWPSPEGILHQTVMAQGSKSETSDYKEGRFSGLFPDVAIGKRRSTNWPKIVRSLVKVLA